MLLLYLLVHFIGEVMLTIMQRITYLSKLSGTDFKCQLLRIFKCQESVQLNCVLVTKIILIPRRNIKFQAINGIKIDFRECFRGAAMPFVFFCCQDDNTSVFAPCLQILVLQSSTQEPFGKLSCNFAENMIKLFNQICKSNFSKFRKSPLSHT